MIVPGGPKAVIPQRFRDEVNLHLIRNLRPSPTPGTPLMLGIHGKPGEGKTYQVETCLVEAGVTTILVSGGQLESGSAGEPARIVREAYLDGGVRISNGLPAAILLNDADAAIGSWGDLTQYTVNTQNVLTELMHLADYPCEVEGRVTPRCPLFMTGNDFTRLYGPLRRSGRMELFRWELSAGERHQILSSMLPWLGARDLRALTAEFPDASVAFWAAVRARIERSRLLDAVIRHGMPELLAAFQRGQDISPGPARNAGLDQVRAQALEILTHNAANHLKDAG